MMTKIYVQTLVAIAILSSSFFEDATAFSIGRAQRVATQPPLRATHQFNDWEDENSSDQINQIDQSNQSNQHQQNIHPSQPFLHRRIFFQFLSKAIATTSVSTLPTFVIPLNSNAATRDPKTGILLPSPGEIESSIPTTWDDDENDNPFSSLSQSSFSRLDSSPDTIFYTEPRFVEHVDDQAVQTMTSYISDRLLQPGDSVLDLCSSWTSHIRPSVKLKRVSGLGMNAKELEANSMLTDWTVLDLNKERDVKLPYEDGSFDVVVCQLSIDYLIYPLEVMKEASRVLKPGGKIAIIFSNRLFLSKAVGLWTGSDDIEHAYTVGSYLHYCNGGFKDIKAEDFSVRKQKGKERVIVGDPLYVVTAIKG